MVSLLLDANLSWRFIDILNKYYDKCVHVDSSGLNIPAKDSDIWYYAKKNQMVIITNDEDFLNIQILRGFPPKVVLFKTGNLKRKQVEDVLINIKQDIIRLIESDDYGLLEIIK
jgi:Uncharacterized protein conserved in bacteria